MSAALISNWAILSASAALTLSSFFAAIKLSGSSHPARFSNISLSITGLATVFLTIAVIARGVAAARAPWGNMYEYAIAGTLAVLVVYLILAVRHDLSGIAIFVLMPALLSLGLAQTLLYIPVADLVPALESGWLVIHVSAAIIAGGGFSLGFAFAIGELVSRRGNSKLAVEQPNNKKLEFVASRGNSKLAVEQSNNEKSELVTSQENSKLTSKLPSSEKLELLSYRVTAWAFVVWTFSVLAGAIWAEAAWGRFWGWDPKETWALITLIAYAAYLHARVTVGWRGGKAAAIAIVGYTSYLFNFFGVNIFFDGLHSYGGL